MAEVPWWTSPALGLRPCSLFSEWFVNELAPVDRCILLPPLSWSHTATAWPSLTVNCDQSVCSFSLNWSVHSSDLGLCSLAWLPSFARGRGWGYR